MRRCQSEIIDFDEPIGLEHFPEGGALPYLWVIDPEGRIVDRFSEADVEAIRRRITDHLRRFGR